MPTPLRLAFAGTPDFAARHLEHLLNGPHRLAAVLTQPDRPAGRGKQLRPSPVKSLAMEANLPVWQPETLKTTDAERVLADFELDVLIVVASGCSLPCSRHTHIVSTNTSLISRAGAVRRQCSVPLKRAMPKPA